MTNRRRWLRPLVIFALLVVAPILLMPLLPLDFLKPAVESKLSASLGRKVEVGSLRLSLWGGPYLTIYGMTAKEDPAFGGGDFLKADKVKADFAVFRYLFNQEVTIDSLAITSPDFTLVKNREGVWSWTTLAGPAAAASAGLYGAGEGRLAFIAPAVFFQSGVTGSALKSVVIENASVRIVDQSAEQPSEAVYKNIALNAKVAPAEGAPTVSHATGEMRADSNETSGGEILKTTLPFDLNISRDQGGGLVVEGTVGPGPFETANFVAQAFTLTTRLMTAGEGQAQAGGQPPPSGIRGQGHISCAGVVLPRINVSEQVARKLQINSIGDMNAGTTISSLETDFQIGQGAYTTTGLRIQQLDGLGDASADKGSFSIESALTLNYAATINLSDEATAIVKSTSPMVGALVMMLESGNRVSVAFNITGDVRSPQIDVDFFRTLGF